MALFLVTSMIWLPLLTACLHPPPPGPTPAAQALQIHEPFAAETKRSLVGLSILVEGGSSTDHPGKEGAGALMWSALSTHPALSQWKDAGGQFRSEWHRDYGALHYRWPASKDLEGILTRVIEEQFAVDGNDMDWELALSETRNSWNRKEGDRGLPDIRDAWLAAGLEGHPYAHPKRGTSRTRSILSLSDLTASFEENLCTARIHTAWSAQESPDLPEGIQLSLNSLGPCDRELPTPKPLPYPDEEQLLILETRGAGTQAFVGLPQRPTSHPFDADALQWAAELLLGPAGSGPITQRLTRAEIDAKLSVRVSPRGERWRQPLLQIELRTQDADPVLLLSALKETLHSLPKHGWSARDVHRLSAHLAERPESTSTSPRLESLLLSEVFGPAPEAEQDLQTEIILELLQSGFSLTTPLIVMEVGDAEPLEAYAASQGISTRVIRAAEIEMEPTD